MNKNTYGWVNGKISGNPPNPRNWTNSVNQVRLKPNDFILHNNKISIILESQGNKPGRHGLEKYFYNLKPLFSNNPPESVILRNQPAGMRGPAFRNIGKTFLLCWKRLSEYPIPINVLESILIFTMPPPFYGVQMCIYTVKGKICRKRCEVLTEDLPLCLEHSKNVSISQYLLSGNNQI